MDNDSKVGIFSMILAIVIVLVSMVLFAPKTDGSGNKLIWDIIYSFVIVPLLCIEIFFFYFEPIKRFKKRVE